MVITSVALLVGINFALEAVPTVTSVTPYFTDVAGGTEITIKEDDLSYVSRVFFGETPGEVLSSSKHEVLVRCPAHMPQTVHVKVQDFTGYSATSEDDYFVYQGKLRGFAGISDNSDAAPFDVDTLAVYPLIETGESPSIVLTVSDASKVFVLNYDDTTVSVINPLTNTVVETIEVGSEPYSGCITPDDKLLFVTNRGDYTVSVIDIATNSNIATINLNGYPTMASVTPDGAWVLVSTNTDDTIAMINVSTLEVDTEFPINIGSRPGAIAITPDGSLAIASSDSDDYVNIIDVATLTSIYQLDISEPETLAVTPDGLQLLIGGDSEYIQKIGLMSPYPDLGKSIEIEPDMLLILPDQAPLGRFC